MPASGQRSGLVKARQWGTLMIDPICSMTVEPNSAAGKFAYEGLIII